MNSKRFIAAVILALPLSSCGGAPSANLPEAAAIVTVPHEVYKPVEVPVLVTVRIAVPVKCDVKIPPPPNFESASLRRKDSIFVLVRGMLAERQTRIAYEERLVSLLKSCVD